MFKSHKLTNNVLNTEKLNTVAECQDLRQKFVIPDTSSWTNLAACYKQETNGAASVHCVSHYNFRKTLKIRN